MRVLAAQYKDVIQVAYSWDGGTLYTLSRSRFRNRPFSGVVQQWDGGDGSPPTVNCGPLAVERLTVLPGGELLVSGATRDDQSRWVGPLMVPYRPGTEQHLPGASWHARLAVSPAGDQIVAETAAFSSRLGSMRAFRLPLDSPVQPVWDALTGPALGMAFDPSGERLAVWRNSILIDGGREKSRFSVRWYDAATGTPLSEPIPIPSVSATAFIVAGGARLATMCGPALLAIDLTDPTALPAVALNPDGKHFTGLAVHPDGRRVLATGNDHTVREYDATTLQELRAYAWKVGRLRCVAIAPDGLTAAAGSDSGKVVVWDLE